jgi:hypothetical protein
VPQLNFKISAALLDRIDAAKPDFLDRKGFICLLLAQQLTEGCRLPAYCVGAGTTGESTTESDLLPPPAQLVEEALTPEEVSPSLLSPMGMGEGVGRESEGTPRKGTKQVSDNLTEHEDLIRDFWRTKGGSKGDRAWSLLLTELSKIQSHHGDTVLRQQIELAINGKWKGITLANLERFTKPTPAASGGYVDSISRDRQTRDNFLAMFSPQEVA